MEATMIHTRVCDVLGIEHPIVQTGMAGGYTNPELVAAVSNAGGLGVLGCLGRTADQAVADIRRIRALTERPFGVNFVLHVRDDTTFAACLAERVPVFSFFRGDDPAEAVARAHAVGAMTMHQITTPAEAARACEVGVDVLVAQGHEAGGHNGPIPLAILLPEVIALAGERPVLAAGGLVDGRDLAHVLRLGAAGILMGTRFLATAEAPVSDGYKRAILAASGPEATVASGIFDLLWGTPWPGVQVRTLRNRLTERWIGREDEMMARRDAVSASIDQAEAADDTAEYGQLAGVGASRIDAIYPAAQVVRDIIAEAELMA
jgi:NAD(P)H-dependent flavin oxidoreductase YrpB (nitropropane dioxygenase family)